MAKHPKRPRDPNQLGKFVVDLATGEADESTVLQTNAKASESGRKGGLRGGKARAEKLTPEERSEIAKKAAEARWGKEGADGEEGGGKEVYGEEEGGHKEGRQE